MLKLWLRRIHLTLAVFTGILLLNISISGALLIYAKDIQAFINPEFWTIPTPQEQISLVLPLSKIIQNVELATNAKIKFIQQEEQAQDAWLVSLTNGKYLNINPYNGEILLEHRYYDTFYGFIMSWHRWLLYTTDTNTKPLKVWISIASLILIIEMLLGCILWLRPKNRLKRLKIRWHAKPKELYSQLHTTIGILTSIPLILIAFSGMAFHWQPATKQVVEWLSFSKVQTPNFQTELAVKQDQYQIDYAYQQGRKALKESRVFRVYLPQEQGEPLKLRLRMPDESHGYSWSWVYPSTGEVIRTFDASNTSLATKIWNFKYKFHIGEFFGWPIKALWFLLSLLPSFFVLSGIYLFMKRKKG